MLQLCTSHPSHEDPPPLSVNFVVEYAALAYAEGVASEHAAVDSVVADLEACAPSPMVALAAL